MYKVRTNGEEYVQNVGVTDVTDVVKHKILGKRRIHGDGAATL
jgi:hypothetical protein